MAVNIANPILVAGQEYLRRGWSVIPVKRSDSKPIENWSAYMRVPAPEVQAVFWWGAPGSEALGLAIVTGQVSGLLVIDLDRNHKDGADGVQTIHDLGYEIPMTVTAVSPRGGWHLYFRHPQDGKRYGPFAGKRGGVDGRGDGGYVVAPPTSRPGVGEYRWMEGRSPDEVEIAPAPQWVLDLWQEKRGAGGQPSGDGEKTEGWILESLLQPCKPGTRHDTALRLAGALANYDLPHDILSAIMENWRVARCADHDADDIARIAEDVVGYRTAEMDLLEPLPLKEALAKLEAVVKEHPDLFKRLFSEERGQRIYGARLALEVGLDPRATLTALVEAVNGDEATARRELHRAQAWLAKESQKKGAM